MNRQNAGAGADRKKQRKSPSSGGDSALEETDYLLRSPENAKRLFASIESLERGDGIVKSMAELFTARRRP
jgi:hypothetical protein